MKICGNAKMIYRRKKNLNTVKLTTLSHSRVARWSRTVGMQEELPQAVFVGRERHDAKIGRM
jgi:hypothetical protein